MHAQELQDGGRTWSVDVSHLDDKGDGWFSLILHPSGWAAGGGPGRGRGGRGGFAFGAGGSWREGGHGELLKDGAVVVLEKDVGVEEATALAQEAAAASAAAAAAGPAAQPVAAIAGHDGMLGPGAADAATPPSLPPALPGAPGQPGAPAVPSGDVLQQAQAAAAGPKLTLKQRMQGLASGTAGAADGANVSPGEGAPGAESGVAGGKHSKRVSIQQRVQQQQEWQAKHEASRRQQQRSMMSQLADALGGSDEDELPLPPPAPKPKYGLAAVRAKPGQATAGGVAKLEPPMLAQQANQANQANQAHQAQGRGGHQEGDSPGKALGAAEAQPQLGGAAAGVIIKQEQGTGQQQQQQHSGSAEAGHISQHAADLQTAFKVEAGVDAKGYAAAPAPTSAAPNAHPFSQPAAALTNLSPVCPGSDPSSPMQLSDDPELQGRFSSDPEDGEEHKSVAMQTPQQAQRQRQQGSYAPVVKVDEGEPGDSKVPVIKHEGPEIKDQAGQVAKLPAHPHQLPCSALTAKPEPGVPSAFPEPHKPPRQDADGAAAPSPKPVFGRLFPGGVVRLVGVVRNGGIRRRWDPLMIDIYPSCPVHLDRPLTPDDLIPRPASQGQTSLGQTSHGQTSHGQTCSQGEGCWAGESGCGVLASGAGPGARAGQGLPQCLAALAAASQYPGGWSVAGLGALVSAQRECEALLRIGTGTAVAWGTTSTAAGNGAALVRLGGGAAGAANASDAEGAAAAAAAAQGAAKLRGALLRPDLCAEAAGGKLVQLWPEDMARVEYQPFFNWLRATYDMPQVSCGGAAAVDRKLMQLWIDR